VRTLFSILLLLCLALICVQWHAGAAPVPHFSSDPTLSSNHHPDSPATHEVNLIAVALLHRNSAHARQDFRVHLPAVSQLQSSLASSICVSSRLPFHADAQRPPPNQFSLPLLI